LEKIYCNIYKDKSEYEYNNQSEELKKMKEKKLREIKEKVKL